MIIISDTTPIISLMKISQLELLEKMFGEVLIPEAVFNELTADNGFYFESEKIKNCHFIKKVIVNEKGAVSILRRSSGLDLGESEAIILADNNKADILLMDEAKGRQVAELMGLNIMGTVGLLISAYENNLISLLEVRKAFDMLKNSNRRISDNLFNYALNKIKEIEQRKSHS